MNEAHLKLCASLEWAAVVREELLPWVLDGRSLGTDLLELGPGPGRTTDVLRTMVPSLTAVELDRDLAGDLAARLAGTNVDVVVGDGSRLPFADGRFSAAASLTMLHHVPSPELQDRLLAEVCRVLRPGGTMFGTDGTDRPARRALHEDDIFVPVDPDTFGDRLVAAGYADVAVEVDPAGERLRFRATR